MEKEPKVSIILVNYNGYQDTIECLKSLKESEYDNYEVIIVENGSKDYEKIKND
ncbi:MAG: glycosyltransferase, partial [Lachnospiraceae bacterium]|nr:glycosyltransferase [Lachnospiraceae bacterium]